MSEQDQNPEIETDLLFVGGYHNIDDNEANSAILRELTDEEITTNPFEALKLTTDKARAERAAMFKEFTHKQLKHLDKVFETDQATGVQLAQDLSKTEGFLFEPDPEWDPENLLWYRCGTLRACRIIDGSETGVVVMRTDYGSLLSHGKTEMVVHKQVNGKFQDVKHYPEVTFVEIPHFTEIISIAVAQGRTGISRRLSPGSDYKVENGRLMLLERIKDNEYATIEGHAWAHELTMRDPGVGAFPFPTKPSQRGTKALCELCPNQFSCLAGQQPAFTLKEYEVIISMNGGKNPFLSREAEQAVLVEKPQIALETQNAITLDTYLRAGWVDLDF